MFASVVCWTATGFDRSLSFLVLAISLLFVTACAPSQNASPDSVRFVVIGDWGNGGSAPQLAVAAAINDFAADHSIDFIVSTGDNVYPHGVTSVTDPLWDEVFENVYTLPNIMHLSWYNVLGNHDYHGDYRSEIAYQQINPRWVLPATYYQKSWLPGKANEVLIVFTDSSPYLSEYRANPEKYHGILDQDTDAQSQWLEETLCQSTAHWKFVIGHHPMYSVEHHGNETEEIQAAWLHILNRCGAYIYFAGHEHHLQHDRLGCINHFISGSGSKLRLVDDEQPSLFKRNVNGFAYVEVSGSLTQVSFISATGEELYMSKIPHLRPAPCKELQGSGSGSDSNASYIH